MKQKHLSTKKKYPSRRVHFPDAEANLPWLSMLLDAYSVIDEGISVAVEKEERRRKTKLACREGCDSCCRTHSDIPLYPLELVGIYWFATERMAPPLRDILKEHFASHRPGDACPFLMEGLCSIHPLRPVGCRQFNVFNSPCSEGEDPYFTRRADVLTPIEDYTNRAFSVMLPFYGVHGRDDETFAIKNIIHTRVINLQAYDWKKLVKVMEGQGK